MDILPILNTKGVAKRLGCTETWIHKLVSSGKLKAYTYDDNGVLVEHMVKEKRRGQGLYFLISDVDAYQSRKQRHPRGSNIKSM